jgi:hypothetical protein
MMVARHEVPGKIAGMICPIGNGMTRSNVPGISCLATIIQSLRDRTHLYVEARERLSVRYGAKSR